MLSFTHQSKGTGNKWMVNQPHFETIMITNKLPKQVSPKKEQKLIGKVTQGKKQFRQSSKDFHKEKPTKTKQAQIGKNDWNTGGIPKGAFDKNLKRNELAAEQRRLRAELKKQKQLNHQQIIINEKKIGTKAIKMMKEKDEQIQYLRQMIQKEKQQKAKIDQMYEQKRQQIERERLELIGLQRRIPKQGFQQKKVIQQIKKITSPQKDSHILAQSKGRQASQFVSRQTRMQQPKRSYQQPTQSEALHQKNILRQQQLDYLINQRESIVKGMPSINYTPTLIPLLSKASYKIVSTHVSQIVELLIQDLLEEQVYLLEQIQLEQAKEREENKSKQVLNEYYDMITEFVNENDEISSKVGKYSTMNFTDVYKPKHYPEQQKRSAFSYDDPKSPSIRRVSLEQDFDEDRMEQIDNRKQRFIRFVSNFDQYKKPNMDMFVKCTEQIIDEAIQKLAKELDKGSGEFVDIVFRNQFN